MEVLEREWCLTMARGVTMVVTSSAAENAMYCEVREWCSCGVDVFEGGAVANMVAGAAQKWRFSHFDEGSVKMER